jgi:hypothetical protein
MLISRRTHAQSTRVLLYDISIFKLLRTRNQRKAIEIVKQDWLGGWYIYSKDIRLWYCLVVLLVPQPVISCQIILQPTQKLLGTYICTFRFVNKGKEKWFSWFTLPRAARCLRQQERANPGTRVVIIAGMWSPNSSRVANSTKLYTDCASRWLIKYSADPMTNNLSQYNSLIGYGNSKLYSTSYIPGPQFAIYWDHKP